MNDQTPESTGSTYRHGRRRAVHVLAMVTSGLLPGVTTLLGAGGRPDSSEDPEAYVLFVGLDVFTEATGKRQQVVAASDRDVLVMEEGAEAMVPAGKNRLTAQVTPRLSRTEVMVSTLAGQPVYSPGANPMVHAQSQALALRNVESDRQELSEKVLRDWSSTAAQAGANAAAGAPGAAEELPRTNQKLADATSDLTSKLTNPEFQSFLPDDAQTSMGQDGFEVAFRASAPERQAGAYGVIRLLVRLPEKPSELAQVLKVFPFSRDLTPEPRKFVIRMLGLSPGFVVESYHVHVYANGREIATNLSPNRVALSEDEAHQYLVLQHAHRHKRARVPAQLVPELRPPASRALVAGRETALVNLEINAGGRIERIGESGGISAELPPDIAAAVRNARFLPALVDGKPVASTGTFALGELFGPSPES